MSASYSTLLEVKIEAQLAPLQVDLADLNNDKTKLNYSPQTINLLTRYVLDAKSFEILNETKRDFENTRFTKIELEKIYNTIPTSDKQEVSLAQFLRFAIIKTNGNLIAIYDGKKSGKEIGFGQEDNTLKAAQNLITGEWLAVKVSPVPTDDNEFVLGKAAGLAITSIYHESIGKESAKGMRRTLVMHRAPGKELFQFMDQQTVSSEEKTIRFDFAIHKLSPQQRLKLITKTLEALSNLHDKLIIHRDIKSSNIFYDVSTETATLLDYGSAFKVESLDQSYSLPPAGTYGYTPLEGIDFENNGVAEYSSKSDIFAWAISIAESLGIITSPDDSREPFAIVPDALNSSSFKEMFPDAVMRQKIFTLLTKMTAEDPKSRPTAAESLKKLDAIKTHMLSQSRESKEVKKSQLVVIPVADFFDKDKILREDLSQFLKFLPKNSDLIVLTDDGNYTAAQYAQVKQLIERYQANVYASVFRPSVAGSSIQTFIPSIAEKFADYDIVYASTKPTAGVDGLEFYLIEPSYTEELNKVKEFIDHLENVITILSDEKLEKKSLANPKDDIVFLQNSINFFKHPERYRKEVFSLLNPATMFNHLYEIYTIVDTLIKDNITDAKLKDFDYKLKSGNFKEELLLKLNSTFPSEQVDVIPTQAIDTPGAMAAPAEFEPVETKSLSETKTEAKPFDEATAKASSTIPSASETKTAALAILQENNAQLSSLEKKILELKKVSKQAPKYSLFNEYKTLINNTSDPSILTNILEEISLLSAESTWEDKKDLAELAKTVKAKQQTLSASDDTKRTQSTESKTSSPDFTASSPQDATTSTSSLRAEIAGARISSVRPITPASIPISEIITDDNITTRTEQHAQIRTEAPPEVLNLIKMFENLRTNMQEEKFDISSIQSSIEYLTHTSEINPLIPDLTAHSLTGQMQSLLENIEFDPKYRGLFRVELKEISNLLAGASVLEHLQRGLNVREEIVSSIQKLIKTLELLRNDHKELNTIISDYIDILEGAQNIGAKKIADEFYATIDSLKSASKEPRGNLFFIYQNLLDLKNELPVIFTNAALMSPTESKREAKDETRKFSNYYIPPQLNFETSFEKSLHLHLGSDGKYRISLYDENKTEKITRKMQQFTHGGKPRFARDVLRTWSGVFGTLAPFQKEGIYPLIRAKNGEIYAISEGEQKHSDSHSTLVGKGTHGTVKIAVNITTGESFALKMEKVELKDETEEANVLRALDEAIAIFEHTPNPNKHDTLNAFLKTQNEDLSALSQQHRAHTLKSVKGRRKNILMKLHQGQDVDIFLKKHPHLSFHSRMQLAIQMIKETARFNNENFIHGDIKPPNFMYDASTGKISLIDFGDTIDLLKVNVFAIPPQRIGSEPKKSLTLTDIHNILLQDSDPNSPLRCYVVYLDHVYYVDTLNKTFGELPSDTVKPFKHNFFPQNLRSVPNPQIIKERLTQKELDDISKMDADKIHFKRSHEDVVTKIGRRSVGTPGYTAPQLLNGAEWPLEAASALAKDRVALQPSIHIALYTMNKKPNLEEVKDIPVERAYIYVKEENAFYFLNKNTDPTRILQLVVDKDDLSTNPHGLSERLNEFSKRHPLYNFRSDAGLIDISIPPAVQRDLLLAIRNIIPDKLPKLEHDFSDVELPSSSQLYQEEKDAKKPFPHTGELYKVFEARERRRIAKDAESKFIHPKASFESISKEIELSRQFTSQYSRFTDRYALAKSIIETLDLQQDKNVALEHEIDRIAAWDAAKSLAKAKNDASALLAFKPTTSLSIEIDANKIASRGLYDLQKILEAMLDPNNSRSTEEFAQDLEKFHSNLLARTDDNPVKMAIIDLKEFLSIGHDGKPLEINYEARRELIKKLKDFDRVVVVSNENTADNLIGTALLRNLFEKENILIHDEIFENPKLRLAKVISDTRDNFALPSLTCKLITNNASNHTLNKIIDVIEKFEKKVDDITLSTQLHNAIKESLLAKVSFIDLYPFLNRQVINPDIRLIDNAEQNEKYQALANAAENILLGIPAAKVYTLDMKPEYLLPREAYIINHYQEILKAEAFEQKDNVTSLNANTHRHLLNGARAIIKDLYFKIDPIKRAKLDIELLHDKAIALHSNEIKPYQDEKGNLSLEHLFAVNDKFEANLRPEAFRLNQLIQNHLKYYDGEDFKGHKSQLSEVNELVNSIDVIYEKELSKRQQLLANLREVAKGVQLTPSYQTNVIRADLIILHRLLQEIGKFYRPNAAGIFDHARATIKTLIESDKQIEQIWNSISVLSNPSSLQQLHLRLKGYANEARHIAESKTPTFKQFQEIIEFANAEILNYKLDNPKFELDHDCLQSLHQIGNAFNTLKPDEYKFSLDNDLEKFASVLGALHPLDSEALKTPGASNLVILRALKQLSPSTLVAFWTTNKPWFGDFEYNVSKLHEAFAELSKNHTTETLVVALDRIDALKKSDIKAGPANATRIYENLMALMVNDIYKIQMKAITDIESKAEELFNKQVEPLGILHETPDDKDSLAHIQNTTTSLEDLYSEALQLSMRAGAHHEIINASLKQIQSYIERLNPSYLKDLSAKLKSLADSTNNVVSILDSTDASLAIKSKSAKTYQDATEFLALINEQLSFIKEDISQEDSINYLHIEYVHYHYYPEIFINLPPADKDEVLYGEFLFIKNQASFITELSPEDIPPHDLITVISKVKLLKNEFKSILDLDYENDDERSEVHTHHAELTRYLQQLEHILTKQAADVKKAPEAIRAAEEATMQAMESAREAELALQAATDKKNSFEMKLGEALATGARALAELAQAEEAKRTATEASLKALAQEGFTATVLAEATAKLAAAEAQYAAQLRATGDADQALLDTVSDRAEAKAMLSQAAETKNKSEELLAQARRDQATAAQQNSTATITLESARGKEAEATAKFEAAMRDNAQAAEASRIARTEQAQAARAHAEAQRALEAANAAIAHSQALREIAVGTLPAPVAATSPTHAPAIVSEAPEGRAPTAVSSLPPFEAGEGAPATPAAVSPFSPSGAGEGAAATPTAVSPLSPRTPSFTPPPPPLRPATPPPDGVTAIPSPPPPTEPGSVDPSHAAAPGTTRTRSYSDPGSLGRSSIMPPGSSVPPEPEHKDEEKAVAPQQTQEQPTQQVAQLKRTVDSIQINPQLHLILAKRLVLFQQGKENTQDRKLFDTEMADLRKLRVKNILQKLAELKEILSQLETIESEHPNTVERNFINEVKAKISELASLNQQIHEIETIHRHYISNAGLPTQLHSQEVLIMGRDMEEIPIGNTRADFENNLQAAQHKLLRELPALRDADASLTGRTTSYSKNKAISIEERKPLHLINYQNKALYYQGKEPTRDPNKYRAAVVVTHVSDDLTRTGMLAKALMKAVTDFRAPPMKHSAAIKFWEGYTANPCTQAGLRQYIQDNKNKLPTAIKNNLNLNTEIYAHYSDQFEHAIRFAKKLSDSFDNTAKKGDILILKGQDKDILYAVACYREAMALITKNLPSPLRTYEYLADADLSPSFEDVKRAKDILEADYHRELNARLATSHKLPTVEDRLRTALSTEYRTAEVKAALKNNPAPDPTPVRTLDQHTWAAVRMQPRKK